MTPEEVVGKWHIVEAPDEAAWRFARHRLLTASDVAAVLGLDPHKSRNKVLEAKRCPEPPDVFVSSAMRGGQFLEDGVFRWYLSDLAYHNRELGVPPPEGSTCRSASGVSLLVKHPDLALGASPDGLVLDYGVPHLVEIKLTNHRRWVDSWGIEATKVPRAWARYSKVEPPSYGKCPLKHWVQLQTQMVCTGVERGVVVGCCGTERLDFPFDADPHFQSIIISETERFWLDVPAIDAQDGSKQEGTNE